MISTYHQVHPEENIPGGKLKGSLIMQKKYSGSVRISYPRYDKEDVIKEINQQLHFLKSKLSIVLVALFGSYATGNYTTASDIDLLIIYKGEQKKDAYQESRL